MRISLIITGVFIALLIFVFAGLIRMPWESLCIAYLTVLTVVGIVPGIPK